MTIFLIECAIFIIMLGVFVALKRYYEGKK